MAVFSCGVGPGVVCAMNGWDRPATRGMRSAAWGRRPHLKLRERPKEGQQRHVRAPVARGGPISSKNDRGHFLPSDKTSSRQRSTAARHGDGLGLRHVCPCRDDRVRRARSPCRRGRHPSRSSSTGGRRRCLIAARCRLAARRAALTAGGTAVGNRTGTGCRAWRSHCTNRAKASSRLRC